VGRLRAVAGKILPGRSSALESLMTKTPLPMDPGGVTSFFVAREKTPWKGLHSLS